MLTDDKRVAHPLSGLCVWDDESVLDQPSNKATCGVTASASNGETPSPAVVFLQRTSHLTRAVPTGLGAALHRPVLMREEDPNDRQGGCAAAALSRVS